MSSSGSPASTRTRTTPSASSASARAPVVGSVTGPPAPRAPARSTTASAQPAARRSHDVGGPGTSTSSTARSGATDAIAAAMPGVRTTRRAPRPSGCAPAGHRRPLRAQPHDVLPVEEHADRTAVLVGQRPSGVADDRVHLAAEGATVGQRGVRLATGLAPRRVRFEVGGLHPARAQRRRPGTRRELERGRGIDRRAPTLHLPGPRPRLGERVAHRPTAGSVGHRDEGIGRRGVVAEAALPERHARARPPAAHPSRGWPGRWQRRGRDRRWGRRAARRPRRRGSSASRCTGTGGRAAPAPPRGGRPRGAWRAALRAGTRCRGCRTRTGSRRWRRRPRPTDPVQRRRCRPRS